MYRSMMQVFVKGSKEAFELYKKAFNAEVLCALMTTGTSVICTRS